tara:strand:- start:300 stop:674 length:375 start_codon:yes stop_codon:yes gene_type:complete
MANSTVYKLGGADGETFTTKRKTGWIPLVDMSRNVTIRRFNARYKSPESVTTKIYASGDDSTEVATITLPSNIAANGSELSPKVDKFKSLKVGRRANNVMIEVSTSSTNATNIEISKMELEIDA